MASTIIYPYGSAQGVVVPAASSISINTKDQAQIFQVNTSVNQPPVPSLLGTVNNTTATFGPFTNATTVNIIGGAGNTLYAIGGAPTIIETRAYQLQTSPTAVNTTAAITISGTLGGIITSTTAAAVTATLQSGTTMEGVTQLAVGDSYDWSVINTGPNTFTLAAATAHTIVGATAVATLTSAVFRTVKTALNTFITYRMS